MRIEVRTLHFTPLSSRADWSASELMIVASMPIWSPFTRSKPRLAPRGRGRCCRRRSRCRSARPQPPHRGSVRHRTAAPRARARSWPVLQRLAAQFQEYAFVFHRFLELSYGEDKKIFRNNPHCRRIFVKSGSPAAVPKNKNLVLRSGCTIFVYRFCQRSTEHVRRIQTALSNRLPA